MCRDPRSRDSGFQKISATERDSGFPDGETRGHHDFQTDVRRPRTPTKTLQKSEFSRSHSRAGKPQIALIVGDTGHGAPLGSASPGLLTQIGECVRQRAATGLKSVGVVLTCSPGAPDWRSVACGVGRASHPVWAMRGSACVRRLARCERPIRGLTHRVLTRVPAVFHRASCFPPARSTDSPAYAARSRSVRLVGRVAFGWSVE
jgi:hypothetical protein